LLKVFKSFRKEVATCIPPPAKRLELSKQDAEHIIGEAKKEARYIVEKETTIAKKEAEEIINIANKEVEFKKQDIQRQEDRILQKESSLERQTELLNKKDELLSSREMKLEEKSQLLDEKSNEVGQLKIQQETELQRIANLTEEQAREEIMATVEADMAKDMAIYIRNKELEAKSTADKRAKELIVQSLQRFATDVVSETTVSVVDLPSDDMKGRIIGREGRNIRTLETLTGVDLIIDDTPEAVILSGYDPIRREVAKSAIKSLIDDGRIHPSKIEEAVDKAKRNIDQVIRDAGEQATFDLGIHNMHPDLVKIVSEGIKPAMDSFYANNVNLNVGLKSMVAAFNKIQVPKIDSRVLKSIQGISDTIGHLDLPNTPNELNSEEEDEEYSCQF